MKKFTTLLLLILMLACTREKVVVIDHEGNIVKPKKELKKVMPDGWRYKKYQMIDGHKYIEGGFHRHGYLAHAGLGDCPTCTAWLHLELESICK